MECFILTKKVPSLRGIIICTGHQRSSVEGYWDVALFFLGVLSCAIVLSAIGMLVVSGAYAHLESDLSLILGFTIAVGVFLPLGGMAAALIMLLATGVSKRIWQTTDATRITVFMEERLQARRVEQGKVVEL